MERKASTKLQHVKSHYQGLAFAISHKQVEQDLLLLPLPSNAADRDRFIETPGLYRRAAAVCQHGANPQYQDAAEKPKGLGSRKLEAPLLTWQSENFNKGEVALRLLMES